MQDWAPQQRAEFRKLRQLQCEHLGRVIPSTRGISRLDSHGEATLCVAPPCCPCPPYLSARDAGWPVSSDTICQARPLRCQCRCQWHPPERVVAAGVLRLGAQDLGVAAAQRELVAGDAVANTGRQRLIHPGHKKQTAGGQGVYTHVYPHGCWWLRDVTQAGSRGALCTHTLAHQTHIHWHTNTPHQLTIAILSSTSCTSTPPSHGFYAITHHP